ncbi:MAG: Nickel transport ATP-binding protein NikE [Sporomusa sp.]|jgi:peptide/nickel transport system ATP-binding protein|nr:Nickel transport ATP-binding protein NikE [Sporomusa sp.]
MSILVETQGLKKSYPAGSGLFAKKSCSYALAGVDISVKKGKSLGLIGESGCGKSTLGKLIAGLEQPTGGSVLFKGQKISGLRFEQMRPLRRNLQMIFQNHAAAFDPRYTIGETIVETIQNYEQLSAREYWRTAAAILGKVGLDGAYLDCRPDELSGGQRQRANIARALVLQPEFVVCDEPVASLDFSIRKQILDLLNDLKTSFGLTYLFISHDLSTVKYVCSEIAVMYLGKVVEVLESIDRLEQTICHPYTVALFDSVPVSHPRQRKNRSNCLVEWDSRQLATAVAGCRFYNRCLHSMLHCALEEPALKYVGQGHYVACHLTACRSCSP